MNEIKAQLYSELNDYSSVYDNPAYKDAELLWREHRNSCAQCGSTELRLENYDDVWRDGDVVCARCDCYVRGYDAG